MKIHCYSVNMILKDLAPIRLQSLPFLHDNYHNALKKGVNNDRSSVMHGSMAAAFDTVPDPLAGFFTRRAKPSSRPHYPNVILYKLPVPRERPVLPIDLVKDHLYNGYSRKWTRKTDLTVCSNYRLHPIPPGRDLVGLFIHSCIEPGERP